MTSKARCAEICKKPRSRIFKFLWEDVYRLFEYDETFCKAIALQVYFRRMCLEYSFEMHEIFYQKNTELRKRAWDNVIRGISNITIEKNKELLK